MTDISPEHVETSESAANAATAETEASRPRQLWRAWKYLFVRGMIVLLVTYLLVTALMLLRAVKPESALKAATVGLRNVSMPLLEQAQEHGLGIPVGIILVNSTVSLIVMSLIYFARLQNPSRIDQFPRLLRKISIKDPTLRLLAFLPECRKLSNPDLRAAYGTLAVVPVLVVGLLMVVLGSLMAAAAFLIHDSWLTGTLISLALVIPHGVLEIPALILAASYAMSHYFAVREDLQSGNTERAFSVITEAGSARRFLKVAGVVLAMLLVSGLIEGLATEKLGSLMESWLS